ncbi:GGDEF domain-containing protein [Neptuniibacter sp.]|uniref:GGDEF domain-containing protein n=1 Tax=Neptuniibacter sp. TaxID=1962643 RepID=UPI003B5BA591
MKKTKILGSVLIGVTHAFYSLNALTHQELDSSLENLNPNEWYPIEKLYLVFKALEKSDYYSSMLLYEAGMYFIQLWYENKGRALGLGSIGHLKLQDNSNGIKHIFKDYDPDTTFTKLIELDVDRGYAELEVNDKFPIDFLKGVFYHGVYMWGDLFWLDMETIILEQSSECNHLKFIFHFKHQDDLITNQVIDDFIDKLSLAQQPSISPKMAIQLAWRLKGIKKILGVEQQINTTSNENLGKALLNQVKISTDLEESNHTIKKQSITDSLTGLNNRRYFNEASKKMWLSSMRKQEPVSIFLIDIDFFKLYNDNYGHMAGDEALKSVSKCIRDVFQRSCDIVARFGGEEFIVATNNNSQKEISITAEKLRSRLQEENILHEYSNVSEHVTVSIGSTSCIPSKEDSLERLINDSDTALYKAKKAGRNRHSHYAEEDAE